jgi:pyruvate ferredoxin oxidoreductase beta subunit
VANPRKLGAAVRRAVLAAREIGPTYVQIYTPCPTNLKFPPNKTIEAAKEAKKSYYRYEEHITEAARDYLREIWEDK